MSKIELIQAHKEDDTKRKKVRAMNKMTVAAALAALAVGAAAGWFAALRDKAAGLETELKELLDKR